MIDPSALISAAQGYAGTQVSDADAAMSAAVDAVQQIGYYNVSYTPVAGPTLQPPGGAISPPGLDPVDLGLPDDNTGVLEVQDILPIEPGQPPTFDEKAPTYDPPNKPNQLPEFQGSPLTLDLSAAFPSAPSLITPEAPTFTEHEVPVKPTTVMPSFNGSRPADIDSAPSDLATAMDSAYRTAAPQFMTNVNAMVDAELLKLNPQYTAQMAAIEAQLTKYLAGGTGLNAAVEDAIYSRARSKNDAEARRVRDQTLADAAARGFTMPNGALLSAVQQARQGGADNNAMAASEIVKMQGEMEQKNLQFAVTTSAGLRTAMVSALMSYMQNIIALNGQAAAYANSVVNALIETYNATVRAYQARLDGYRTDAQVFQSLIQAALAGIEVYKAEIQALLALTQVDMEKVNVYRARVDVLTAMTNMYRTQVEAAVSKASLEKLKVEVFQAQVQAYGAQVNAKNAEWQGYTAQISGEEAKSRVYSVQAQAYASKVAGYKAVVEAKSAGVQATALSNDGVAKAYIAKVDAYRASVQAKGEVARTKIENQRQLIVAYQAEAQAAVANYQTKTEYYKAVSEVEIKNATMVIEAMLKSAELAQSYGKTIAELHTATANVHANLAGAAMSGMNSLAVATVTS